MALQEAAQEDAQGSEESGVCGCLASQQDSVHRAQVQCLPTFVPVLYHLLFGSVYIAQSLDPGLLARLG